MLIRIKEFVAQLAMIPATLRLIWSASRWWTLIWTILLLFQGILPASVVQLSRHLVDSLVKLVGGGGEWEAIRPVVVVSLLMAAVLLLIEISQAAAESIRTAQAELVQDYINAIVHTKCATLDIGIYESPEYCDGLNRVRSEASSRSLALLENCGGLFQSFITLISMGVILIPYGTWIPVLLLISTLPALFVVLYFDRRYHDWWKRTTQDRRWAQYYDTMLTHSDAAPEMRLFGLAPAFMALHKELRQRLRGEKLRMTRHQSMVRAVASLAGLTIAGATMAWMGKRVLMGVSTLGDLALFYQALSRGQDLMRTLLNSLGKIYSSTLFLGNLFEFLGVQPQITDPPIPRTMPSPLRKGIAFKDVCFSYPGNNHVALQNFTLRIPTGKIIAIVGPNGAGKSTLLKLLCRFYDPSKGCIEIDGIDIRKMSVEELRRQITVLMQTPIPYHATARENIALGDINEDASARRIESAAISAGAHEVIMRLPQGYDTLLGRWFANGSELSSGEWQRVALARAFFRQAEIIVLDEPTSAMDSWAEADWFDRLRNLANGRTGIIITHRFTIAMRADIIHVMDRGKLVESGAHHELVAKGGLYAQSWKAQMQASVSPEEDSEGSQSAALAFGCTARSAPPT